jgi:hypothetical protein
VPQDSGGARCEAATRQATVELGGVFADPLYVEHQTAGPEGTKRRL